MHLQHAQAQLFEQVSLLTHVNQSPRVGVVLVMSQNWCAATGGLYELPYPVEHYTLHPNPCSLARLQMFQVHEFAAMHPETDNAANDGLG